MSQELTNVKMDKLASDASAISKLYGEYTRTSSVEQNRDELRVLRVKTADLLSTLKSEAPIISNEDYQAVLAMRLAVMAEDRLQMAVSGEAGTVLSKAEANIREQASDAVKVLEGWMQEWGPSGAEVKQIRVRKKKSGREQSVTEQSCEFVVSPGFDNYVCPKRYVTIPVNLQTEGGGQYLDEMTDRERVLVATGHTVTITTFVEDVKCKEKLAIKTCYEKTCKSNHIKPSVRWDRVRRCLRNFHESKRPELEAKMNNGVRWFKECNYKLVFGNGIDSFLAELKKLADPAFEFDPIVEDEVMTSSGPVALDDMN